MGVEMGRRGFLAEVNHQMQQAERRRRQQAAAAYRAQVAAGREAEQATKAAERARAAAARANAAERKAAEKLAAQMYVEARLAEVASRNADLANRYAEIDGLLAWTLEVDDYVDLADLKVEEVEHPPFEPGPLGVPTPEMPVLVYPEQPAYREPEAPKGLSSALGGKKKHEEAVNQAKLAHEQAYRQWHEQASAMHAEYVEKQAQRHAAEQKRLQLLAQAQARYAEECRKREAENAARNEAISRLINDLAFDVEEAIQEYVGIVLSNSVYPSSFPVSYDHAFELATRELVLVVLIPEPSSLPIIKEYKYVKAKDEIVTGNLPVREQKNRYGNAVWQVAIRSLHEVFEADRAGRIRSISLTVGAGRISPATGLPETVPLVVVAADREAFTAFDLSNIQPEATLAHLGAAMSKSPFDLLPADTAPGVRVKGR
jgi:restriction system protein